MRKKILIVAKTYPTKSKKYTELVCTAGVDEAGRWYRIYPIPTKSLKEYKGLDKYTWIDAEITKDSSDPRPESYKINISTVKLLNTISTKNNGWAYRKDIVLKSKVYSSREEIVNLANKDNTLSLCLFKPGKFLHVYFESKKTEPLTDEEIRAYKNANANLFEHSSCEVEFNAMPPLPYSIRLEFEDCHGKKSKMNILDWEISQLYWTLKNKNKTENDIKQGIKDKLNWMIEERDLYLCLGTMKQMHGWTSNPFTIIGLFYPPKDPGYTGSLF